MAIQYRIYANNLTGGPVDYTAPAATVSGLTWDTPFLPANADATFLVRSFDTVSGLEDQNADARVRVRLDGEGSDLTVLPNAPQGVTVEARAGGLARVAWVYNSGGQGSAPGGFRVYIGAGSPNFSTPAAVVGYRPGDLFGGYSATLSGLSEGVTYAVSVRSYNTQGEEANTTSIEVVGSAAGPASVVSLAATVAP